ncbi:Prefoldin subunit 5 [Smittium culicis]|uniref:Prefoldin subunit 5 n=1 Tax=Smittium culicis TaxID=133412 RepID=A0A1R1XWB0_9FUNG|nr:Prefoldin subunit 5 [Smittium culicis]
MSSDTKLQQQIKIEDLSLQQLNSLKEQFDDDISNLTNLYSKLKRAQSSFIECNSCLSTIEPNLVPGSSADSSPSSPSISTEQKVLVPLTNSLYVRGSLKNEDKVLVDVGTGYFVEKNLAAAKVFYNKKIEYIQQNSDKLLANITEKQKNLKALVEIMQQKAIASAQAASTSK